VPFEVLQGLDAFLARFREDFRRRDQARWAAVYVQGLLLPTGERKTTGTMARHVVLPPDLVVEDVAQALQNFVNQSPWDEGLVGRRLRALLTETFADPDGAFVVDELAVPKQGRNSVGVQRQFSGTLGGKANCQVAVALYHHGRHGVCPLAARLYLPRSWLGNVPRLEAAGVPEEFRQPRNKAGIALDLLDIVRAEGWPGRVVVAGNGLAGDSDFASALAERGLDCASPEAAPQEGDRPAADDSRPAREATVTARDLGRSLLRDFGLEHFEGRSWRGFHHHACLVLVAFAFRALLDRKAVPGQAPA
jgi:SRSO17 transposase